MVKCNLQGYALKNKALQYYSADDYGAGAGLGHGVAAPAPTVEPHVQCGNSLQVSWGSLYNLPVSSGYPIPETNNKILFG